TLPRSSVRSALAFSARSLLPGEAGLAPLSSGLAPLSSGLAPLSSGLAPLSSGLAPLSSGLAPLSSGLAPLSSGLAPLSSGFFPAATAEGAPLGGSANAGVTAPTRASATKRAPLLPIHLFIWSPSRAHMIGWRGAASNFLARSRNCSA